MDVIPFARRPLAHAGILLGIALFVFGLELALEWRAHQRGHDSLLFGSASEASTSDNAYPFRSPPVAPAKADGVTRLWIAGASHAQDNYQPVERIFPTLTCVRLNQQGQSCEVLNGSNAGTGIDGNLALLAQYAPQYRPDWVLLYQGSIEIQELSKLSFAPTGNGAVTGEAPGDWHRNALDRVRSTIEATTLFAHLTQGLRTRLMAAKVLHPRLPDSIEAQYRQRLEQFVTQVRALGASPVLTTFAARYRHEQLAEFDDELFRSQLRYNPYLSAAGWLDAIDRLNAVTRAVAQQQQVPLIDVAAAVAGDAQAFRDFSHFSVAGHASVADRLAADLLPLWQHGTTTAAVSSNVDSSHAAGSAQ